MNKIEGTVIAASRLESGEQATCGNGLVVVEAKADHDAREAEVERLRDAYLQRVAEGMSRWCKPQSPHLDAIADALQHAKRKHPFFAHFPMEKWLPRQASEALTKSRANLAHMISSYASSGSDVFGCEIAEAREAYARRDYAQTLVELAQCGAVIVRMMEAVKSRIDNTAKAGEEPIK
jgi:hypothetical protein